MKGVFLFMLVALTLSCNPLHDKEIDCARMVECTLVNCRGEAFGTVEVSECDAEGLLSGCCPALTEVTCHCAGF